MGSSGFQLLLLMHAYCQPDELIERFVFFLRTMRRSPATVRAYLAVVRRYVEFSGHVPAVLDPVLKYMVSRRDKGLSQAPMNGEMAQPGLETYVGFRDHVIR